MGTTFHRPSHERWAPQTSRRAHRTWRASGPARVSGSSPWAGRARRVSLAVRNDEAHPPEQTGHELGAPTGAPQAVSSTLSFETTTSGANEGPTRAYAALRPGAHSAMMEKGGGLRCEPPQPPPDDRPLRRIDGRRHPRGHERPSRRGEQKPSRLAGAGGAHGVERGVGAPSSDSLDTSQGSVVVGLSCERESLPTAFPCLAPSLVVGRRLFQGVCSPLPQVSSIYSENCGALDPQTS